MKRREFIQTLVSLAAFAALPLPAIAREPTIKDFREEVMHRFLLADKRDFDSIKRDVYDVCQKYKDRMELDIITINHHGINHSSHTFYWNAEVQEYWCIKLESLPDSPKFSQQVSIQYIDRQIIHPSTLESRQTPIHR
jgi:hypothetical protein